MINTLSSSFPQPVNSTGAIAGNDRLNAYQKPEGVKAQDNRTQPIEAESAKSQASNRTTDQTASNVDVYAAADQAKEAAQASGTQVERGSVIDIAV